MTTNNLPFGAAEILSLRKAGKRPADMVLVSLIGPLHKSNPVVIANPSRTYDWRFLVDLNVLVVANSDTPQNAVRCVLAQLKALPVRSLSLWLADRQDGRHLIVDGVLARPHGLLRYMDAKDRQNYAGIGLDPHGIRHASNL